jgi:putative membrane protein
MPALSAMTQNPNQKVLMKRKPISILQLVMMAFAAGSLCFIGTVRAQENTSVSDNPHLRAKEEPRKAAASPAAATLSEKDRKFIQEAANGGVSEVADGKVAEERGQSAEVKKIGARMVADHSRTNNELVALAKKKGLSIDTSKGTPRNFDRAIFDRQYLASMEKDHETDIKIFEKEASSGDDADLKSWASKTLPALKAHLAMVKGAMKKK